MITQIVFLSLGKCVTAILLTSKTPPLKPLLIIKLNGSVVCGHCICMPGQGKTGSHV